MLNKMLTVQDNNNKNDNNTSIITSSMITLDINNSNNKIVYDHKSSSSDKIITPLQQYNKYYLENNDWDMKYIQRYNVLPSPINNNNNNLSTYNLYFNNNNNINIDIPKIKKVVPIFNDDISPKVVNNSTMTTITKIMTPKKPRSPRVPGVLTMNSDNDYDEQDTFKSVPKTPISKQSTEFKCPPRPSKKRCEVEDCQLNLIGKRLFCNDDANCH